MGDITISQAWAWVLAGCAAIAAIAKAWEIIKHWGRGDMKKELDKYGKALDNDNKRIKSLEEGQIITMRTLLALTQHAINGNNVAGLQKCREELQDFLIQR